MSDWRDDEARTRGVFREVNEQIRKVHFTFGRDGREEAFVCECGNPACTKIVVLAPGEYEAIRVHARRFLIAVNHENPEIERVVNQNGSFAIVETFVGEASRVREETDPRILSPSH